MAKNRYFFPLSCIGPVSCNISIHTCAQSTLIPPVCVCVCVRARKEKNVALNKSCPVCLNCSIKTIFVFDTEEQKKGELTEHRLDVSGRWRGFLLFCLAFSLNSGSHYCAEPQAVRGKKRTGATAPEPRGPQEPRGVPTLMEA